MAVRRIDGWPALMTLETAAAYLDVSPSTISRRQREGRIIPTSLDGTKRYSRAELDRFIESLPEWEGDR